MSGLGHLAFGFAVRPFTPQVPLVVLLAAGEVNDILYFIFSNTGLEKKVAMTVDISQGVRYLAQVPNPWSHGLFMSIVWAALAAGLAFLFYRERRISVTIGLIVFSHWALDFIMHSNLPLFFDGSPLVGIGLENTGPGFILITVLDLLLLAGGIAFYLMARKYVSNGREI
jgi:hypothetical protein